MVEMAQDIGNELEEGNRIQGTMQAQHILQNMESK